MDRIIQYSIPDITLHLNIWTWIEDNVTRVLSVVEEVVFYLKLLLSQLLANSWINYWQAKLTRVLPIVEIESCVSDARAFAGGGILRVAEGILCGHGGDDHLVLVKVDTNLEWSGEAAGWGVSSGGRGGSPKVTTHPKPSRKSELRIPWSWLIR